MHTSTHLCAALALSVSLAGITARASDLWTRPHAGILHLHRTSQGVDLHVVLVDLRDPSLSIVSTRPADRFITTSEFARRYDARIALNANFFDRNSCGLAVGAGEVFGDSYEDGCDASMGFGSAHAPLAFDSRALTRGPVPAAWVSEVITGKPWLMRDGRGAGNWLRPQHLYRPNPRSVAGLTADRSKLVLLAADGRRAGVAGLNGFEVLDVMREFGVSDAVNLDGGGSTAMIIDGRVANRPSGGVERKVATHLGVRVAPIAAPRAPHAAASPAAPVRPVVRASLSRVVAAAPAPAPPPTGDSRAPSPFAWSVLATFGMIVAAMKTRPKS